MRQFAANGGRDVVVGRVEYNAATMRFSHHVRGRPGKAVVGLIALGCFSAATLRAAIGDGGQTLVRFLSAGRSFEVIDDPGFFPMNGLRFLQAIGASPVHATEHQLGFASIARAAAMLPLASRLCILLNETERLDRMLSQLATRAYSGRSIELLLQLGEHGCATDMIVRLLSTPADVMALDNVDFGRLLWAVRRVGLDAEFVEMVRPHCNALLRKHFNHVGLIFDCAALVLNKDELDAMMLGCVRSMVDDPVVRPTDKLIEIAERFCSEVTLARIRCVVGQSRSALQQLTHRSGDEAQAAAAGSRADASPEQALLLSIASSDRVGFIGQANLILRGPEGTAALGKLVRTFTSEVAGFALQAGEIVYAAHERLSETLALSVILNDSTLAAAYLDDGVSSATDPLTAAWRSRHGDYAPLNALLDKWLREEGLTPIQVRGRNLNEVLRSCYADHAMPEATDHGTASVILSAYNPDPHLLNTAVDSVLAQTYLNLELIIVDDGSEATGARLLRSVAASDGRVRHVRNPENAGPYHCRNLAMAVATGAFVAFHDGDDVAHPQRLGRQIEALIESDLHQLCCAAHMRFDHDGALQFELNPDTLNVRGDGPVTSVIRRRALDIVGRFAEIRSRGDIEMRFRIQNAFGQHAVRSLEAPLMYCCGSPTGLSASANLRYGAHVALFRRAFRERATASVLNDRFVSEAAGRLAIPLPLRSDTRW